MYSSDCNIIGNNIADQLIIEETQITILYLSSYASKLWDLENPIVGLIKVWVEFT
jgi:hypothetical protein